MGWFSDLLQGIPVNSVLRERMALAEQKFKEIEQEKKELEARVSTLETENAGLKEKLRTLEAQNSQNKPKLQEGCYCFEGEEGRLYCPACFDTKGTKYLTTAIGPKRMCTVCKAVMGD